MEYNPTEEKNIGIETSYDFSDSIKILFVTVTNKSNKDIRVFNANSEGRAFYVYYFDSDGGRVASREFPLGFEPEMNQKIILKPGASETFTYRVFDRRKRGYNSYRQYDLTKGPITKITINYWISYQFMDEKDPYKVFLLRKETEMVALD